VYTFTVSSNKVGEDIFAFETRAKTSDATATMTYSAGDGNFDQESSTIVANPVEIDADGVMTSTVTVTMYYDAAGQKPIIGYTGLTLVDTDGTQLGDVSAVTEVGNGVYTFTVSSNKVGEDIFAFETRAKTSDATATITYSAGDGNFDQKSSTIVANPVEIDADGVMTSTVTVRMYYDDAGHKQIIGYTSLTLIDTDGTQLGDVSAVTEVGNGVYTFTVSSNKVGEDIFAFETRAKTSDATATITYSAGDGNFDQESSTIVANPGEIDADGVMTSTVTVTMYYDAAGQKPI